MITLTKKILPFTLCMFSPLMIDAKGFQSDELDFQESQERCCFTCRDRAGPGVLCFCKDLEKDDCRPCWYMPLRECIPCWGKSVKIDFLYWGAQNNGFAYAASQKDSLHSSLIRIERHWSPGFRIQMAHEFEHDFWQLCTKWTWYKNNHRENNTSSQFSSLFPVLGAGTFLEGGNAHWSFSQNLIDLDLVKEYWLSKAFSVRPVWGLRAAWLHQRFATQSGISSGTVQRQLFVGKDNSFGVGPKAGVEVDWLLGWGLSVLGTVSGSALYGTQKVNQKMSVSLASGFSTSPHLFDQLNQFTPNLEMFLGLQWGLCFNEAKTALSIQAGWESNYWWNQFHIPLSSLSVAPLGTNIFPSVSNQALETQGLTLNLKLNF